MSDLVNIELAQYKKEEFRQISWERYGEILETLHKKVSKYLSENKIKVDAVVPILRAGAIPGTYLAVKLGLLRTIPLQYHYFFKDGDLSKIRLRRLLNFPKGIDLPKNPTFLLVESDCCFGTTSETAAEYLKELYPGCKIIFAADSMDYSFQKLKNMNAIFYGDLHNETKTLTKEECKKKGIDPMINYLPWENLEEEYTTVQAKQFKYKDLEQIDPESK